MFYKYSYHFSIEGYNRVTDKHEVLALIEQERNIGIDHQLYKIIRTESHIHRDTHYGINVKIYRMTAPAIYPEFVGMMFFDSWELCSHRGFIINNDNGTTRSCHVWNWRDLGSHNC